MRILYFTFTFANYVRLPPHIFDELLNRISSVIQRRDTHMRQALDAGMKLAMTLRHLAIGDRYHTLRYDFRCGYTQWHGVCRTSVRPPYRR